MMLEQSDQYPATLTNYQWLEDHHLIKAPFRLQALNMLEFQADARVLDVACGPGFWTEMIATSLGEHGRVIGIDIDSDLIAEASNRIMNSIHSDKMSYVVDDLQKFQSKMSFTDVICFNCLPYFRAPSLVVKSLKKHLAPGGRLHLKETDMSWSYFSGMDSSLFQRALSAASNAEISADNALRYDGFFGRRLFGLVSGMSPITIKSNVLNVHFQAPFSTKQLQYIQLSLDSIFAYAEAHLGRDDREMWKEYSSLDRLSSLSDQDIFCMSEIICTAYFH